MKYIVCLFKGHIWKKRMRLAVLDDSPVARYIGKSHECQRCGKEKNL